MLQQETRYVCYCCGALSGRWHRNVPTPFVLCHTCTAWVTRISKEGILRHKTRTILPPKECVCCGIKKAGAWVRNEDDFGVVIGWLCSPCRSWIEYEGKYPKGGYTKRGEMNPNWKGGSTAILMQIRNSDEYEAWRLAVLIRDQFKCTKCEKNDYVEVHHIIAISRIIHDYNIQTFNDALGCQILWDITNGQTLCITHHGETDNYCVRITQKERKS